MAAGRSPFGTDLNPVLNVLASGWSITSVGRFQTTVTDLGNVRLVGMSVDDLQGMYKFYRKENASTGIDEIWMLPDDVLVVDELPHTATGKIMKTRLRELYGGPGGLGGQ